MRDFTTIPERLIYYLDPVEISCLREIKRSHDLYRKCDLTNNQFSVRVGVCPRLITTALSTMQEKMIIEKDQKWLNGVERRIINLGSPDNINKHLIHEKDVQIIIKDKIINRLSGRVELARIMETKTNYRNQPWVILPNSIVSPNQLAIYGILYGQFNRGRGEIRISNTQLSALANIGLGAVKTAIHGLIVDNWITVENKNRRNRQITLLVDDAVENNELLEYVS